jgi:ABC-type xylose transport system permease subunit
MFASVTGVSISVFSVTPPTIANVAPPPPALAVDETSGSIGIIIGVIVGVVIALVLALVFMRRRRTQTKSVTAKPTVAAPAVQMTTITASSADDKSGVI